MAESTYKVQKESVSGQHTRSLLYWANEWEKLAGQPDKKVLRFPDTLINKMPYAHIKVIDFDSTANNKHVYSVKDIVLDKKTKLPFLINWQIMDMADDGTFVGLTENHAYSKYMPDQKGFPDLSVASIPDYFKLPTRRQPVKYLPYGTPAPQLMIHNLAGKALQLSDLKGKVVLLSFSLVGCPHSVGASQMLNRLYDKYGNEVMILNIYPMDQAESINDFDKRENIKTASFTSEKTIVNDFPIDGYPSFYLLNRDGIIVQSYSGFFKGLESQIVAKIDEISEANAAGQ
ncbi:Thiol-disulfide isomerase or thioredoxin [bacterium A37T11]|nr:Thiol-disulfide isomerase or thioredoxin [bacterium A37T11]